jgi:hypothetical protein
MHDYIRVEINDARTSCFGETCSSGNLLQPDSDGLRCEEVPQRAKKNARRRRAQVLLVAPPGIQICCKQ